MLVWITQMYATIVLISVEIANIQRVAFYVFPGVLKIRIDENSIIV